MLIVLCDHGLSAVKEFGRYSPCFRTASTPTSKGNSAKKKKKHAQVTEPHIDSIELKSIEMKIELKKNGKIKQAYHKKIEYIIRMWNGEVAFQNKSDDEPAPSSDSQEIDHSSD